MRCQIPCWVPHPNVAPFATGAPGGPAFGPLGWWTLGWGFSPLGPCKLLTESVPAGPFNPTRFIGYSTRSGEYTRSRYLATLAQRKPRVTGCAGSPWILVARPFSTVISTPQASGQSWGQAA